jgi:hypothetical protein
MGLAVEDIGELAYGGLVTGLQRWDKTANRTLWKKYSTYGYLIPGGLATAAQAMGWMRQFDSWTSRLAHGFIYGFPGFVMEVVDAYAAPSADKAVKEAETIVRNARRRINQTQQPGFEGLRTY